MRSNRTETQRLIHEHLEAGGRVEDSKGPLFRPVKNSLTKVLEKSLDTDAVYRLIKEYAKAAEIDVEHFSPHSLRATAATNALEHEADIAQVPQWLGHANFAITRLYDKRSTRPEDSPTFKVNY